MATSSGKKQRKRQQLVQDMGYQNPIDRKPAQKFPKLEPQTYRQQDYIDALN